MDLKTLTETHRTCGSSDIDALCELANTDPSSITVRQLYYGDSFPFSTVAHGPFFVSEEDGVNVLHGFDVSNESAQLRIVGEDTVEIKDGRNHDWTALAFGSVRLLIPINPA